MSFGGIEELVVYGEFIFIGGVGLDINKCLSVVILDILKIKLFVLFNRFYIKFFDVKVWFVFLLNLNIWNYKR